MRSNDSAAVLCKRLKKREMAMRVSSAAYREQHGTGWFVCVECSDLEKRRPLF